MSKELQSKYDELLRKFSYLKVQNNRPIAAAAIALENHIELGKHQSMTEQDRILWKDFHRDFKQRLIDNVKD